MLTEDKAVETYAQLSPSCTKHSVSLFGSYLSNEYTEQKQTLQNI